MLRMNLIHLLAACEVSAERIDFVSTLAAGPVQRLAWVMFLISKPGNVRHLQQGIAKVVKTAADDRILFPLFAGHPIQEGLLL